MKLKLTNCKIKRYEYGKYYVDIFDTVEDGAPIWEATLTKKGSGYTTLIFGVPKHQINSDITFTNFLDIVEANVSKYIVIYEEELASID